MRVIVIGGPTASGKSGLSMKLAQALDGEIVSADSVQVYRGLDIGSAKPGKADMQKVRHHLIDVLEPEQSMDAGLFVKMARPAIADIVARGKVPLITGGTGLYIKALLFGLANVPEVDSGLRERLKQKLQCEGVHALHQQLASLDPAGAARIHTTDKQRIIRALEVVMQTGKPLAFYQQRHEKVPCYDYLLWGVGKPRAQLRRIIAQRAELMWHGGLLEETKQLLARGVDQHTPGLLSLGYRQAVAVINHGMDEPQALEQMIRLTQAYAKRQVTWFRKMPGIKWVDPEQYEQILGQCREFLIKT